jgi:hypothetical protein
MSVANKDQNSSVWCNFCKIVAAMKTLNLNRKSSLTELKELKTYHQFPVC